MKKFRNSLTNVAPGRVSFVSSRGSTIKRLEIHLGTGGGRLPAETERRLGGAMATTVELTGVHRYSISERQTMKETHQNTEELTLGSLEYLVWVEEVRGELAAPGFKTGDSMRSKLTNQGLGWLP